MNEYLFQVLRRDWSGYGTIYRTIVDGKTPMQLILWLSESIANWKSENPRSCYVRYRVSCRETREKVLFATDIAKRLTTGDLIALLASDPTL